MPDQNEQDLINWANQISTGVSDAASQVGSFLNEIGKANQMQTNPYGGNSLLLGKPQPSSAAGSKITPGPHTPGYGTDTNMYGQMYATAPQSTELQALDPEAYRAQMDAIYQKYGTSSGGPNAAILRSLNQGIQQKNQQYKQNTASVENMYGQLTQESENATAALMNKYQQAVGQTGERASGLQNVLAQEGAAQEARRVALAAELGISPENALTQYGSQQRLNEAMGQILGQGQSWQNLLQSQQLSAKQQADRMQTAIGNTKSATRLGLTEAYQNAINNYKNQIAQEKSKTATRTLDPFGQVLASKLVDKFSTDMFGAAPTKEQAADATKAEVLSQITGTKVTDPYGPEYETMLAAAREAFSGTGTQLSDTEFAKVMRFMKAYNINPSYLPMNANRSTIYGAGNTGY